MYLILALLLQATPATTPAQEQRAVVVKGLDQLDKDISEFSGFIETRFSVDSDAPGTGLTVTSEDAGADGLHPIIVISVIKGSPADAAGVHPGDRVVRVGARRIEHETVQVFRSITDGTAGPLQMALARNGTEIVVTVHRQPLVCIQRASARIDQKVWHERITEVRQLSGMIRSFLDNETAGFPEQRYPAAKDQLVKLFGLFGHLTKMLESELTDALTKECTFLTK